MTKKKGKCVRLPLPCFYFLTCTECHKACVYFLTAFKNLPSTHLKIHGKTLTAKVIGQDRAGHVRSASQTVFGNNVCSMLCARCTERKFDNRSAGKRLKNNNNKKMIKSHVQSMTNCQTKEMHSCFGSACKIYWNVTLKEQSWLKSSREMCTHDAEWHNNWFLTASNMPGVISDSNVIECFNNSQIKAIIAKTNRKKNQ